MKHSKKVQTVINYIAAGKDYKRWRLLKCIMEPDGNGFGNAKDATDRQKQAEELIAKIEKQGFKAKVWAPLPRHKNSGHTHIVVLCTFHEFCDLTGVPCRRQVGDYS